jgi:hypothetical protein
VTKINKKLKLIMYQTLDVKVYSLSQKAFSGDDQVKSLETYNYLLAGLHSTIKLLHFQGDD